MDPKELVKLIRSMLVVSFESTSIVDSSLPDDTAQALKQWASDNNIAVDDGDTDLELCQMTFSEFMPVTFVASYSGDDPDQFFATAIIQNGVVIGESIDVGS